MVVPTEHALHEAIQVSSPELADNVRLQKIEQNVAKLKFSAATVRMIQEVFLSEMEKGIHQQPSSLQMENTYVTELLDGTEEGLYLALDLGGTNFRLLLLELAHGVPVRTELKMYQISPDLRVGSAIFLFDFLAECISDFVMLQGLQDVKLPLGFTFSFPMINESLDIGILVTWTKTFDCPDAVNEDAVRLLREALHRRGDTKVEVVAILNDTTGTLVQGSVLDPDTAIGLILGTGSNACYTERYGDHQTIIDIEWGAFGDNGVLDFIKTDYDRENDANSLIANSFTFEKYISGRYLGEIVRLVLARLTKEDLLFIGDHTPGSILNPGELQTMMVSKIEQDSVDGGTDNTREVLENFGIVPDEEDMKIIQYVCEVVSNRAALLVAICLAVLLRRIDREIVTIAVDGSLYKHHPRLDSWIKQYIKLLAPDHKFKIIHVEDGSGKGAALVAAIAERIQKRNE
ncbi:hexokinase-2 [Ptiloglossa arizonensis]|uniref:hexokinase-2 n=1 Tax=Ptiloglossa arizonensis TaxID=3350558 RepID=UPI003F9EE415